MKNKKRVAITIPSLNIGGAETMSAQLATHIDQTKFEILYIVIYGRTSNSLQKYIDESGINVVFLGKEKGLSLKAMCSMYTVLKRFKPDVIHTHIQSFAYTLPYLVTHRLKMLHTIHNRPLFESNRKGRALLRFLFTFNKAIPVAISDTIKQETIELYKKDNVELIYNPVDVKRFKPIQPRYYEDKEKLKLLNVGRLAPQKNQLLLLDSFSRVVKDYPQVVLEIAGGGELKEELEYKVKRLGITNNVKFLGIVGDIEKYMENSDVFILSSDFEGLPMTILEAMATGLPIISTSVGGVPDIVKKNGILVEPGDEDGLVQAMIQLISNKALREKFGKMSTQLSEQYDIDTITKKYELLYEKFSS
jgi:L-malate glycosyltransferase